MNDTRIRLVLELSDSPAYSDVSLIFISCNFSSPFPSLEPKKEKWNEKKTKEIRTALNERNLELICFHSYFISSKRQQQNFLRTCYFEWQMSSNAYHYYCYHHSLEQTTNFMQMLAANHNYSVWVTEYQVHRVFFIATWHTHIHTLPVYKFFSWQIVE